METETYVFNALSQSGAVEAKKLQKLLPWANVSGKRVRIEITFPVGYQLETDRVLQDMGY